MYTGTISNEIFNNNQNNNNNNIIIINHHLNSVNNENNGIESGGIKEKYLSEKWRRYRKKIR
jgi:hypothetical protein